MSTGRETGRDAPAPPPLGHSLSVKLAALLAAAFIAVGGLLVVATQAMFEPSRLLELSTDVMLASVVFSLLAALCVFQLFTRRLKRLADAVDAYYRRGDFRAPLALGEADARGDEIERLAAHVEGMSARIADQLGELERVATRRRDLLANVSHDLRTPLASMQGYLEILLLRRGELSEAEERNYLEVAAKHSERLGRLVNDLFQLTKLEADDVHPQRERFPLAELVQDVAQKFALDAAQRGLALQAACGAAMPLVEADIGMVERVLENLVENALRHTPEGGRVTLALGQAGGRASVAVSDTGVGIPADEVDKVFDRFYRADRTGARHHAGLGLAIARLMVQLHGGQLTVRSTPGHGTTFSFDLPLAPRGPSGPEGTPDNAIQDGVPGAQTGGTIAAP
ncbi:sensor histidine kinase [Azohydromonas aeria]|uniref:sensor histidine kinase n=1 Tax=Azohydromonas aeria TaxID=2590212 RepID=UPI001E482698|nr:HAMP domain-containing sensor histidine kinase [Azohydromonas aeria]